MYNDFVVFCNYQPSKSDLLYTVLQALSDWKEMYPFAHDGLMTLASYLLDQIMSMKDYCNSSCLFLS